LRSSDRTFILNNTFFYLLHTDRDLENLQRCKQNEAWKTSLQVLHHYDTFQQVGKEKEKKKTPKSSSEVQL
jgi:hypothetical protein